MTKSAEIKIEILSYWHAGSGSGRGGDVDAIVLKDRGGLPYLPGRTIKGLLREGMQSCEDVGQISAKRTNELFGKPAKVGSNVGSIPGLLTFDDAVMSKEERLYLTQEGCEQLREALFDRFASTKLDKKGMADDHSLRAIELCVPLTLTAVVTGPDDNLWLEELKNASSLVRALGSHRNRGLGRCRISFIE